MAGCLWKNRTKIAKSPSSSKVPMNIPWKPHLKIPLEYTKNDLKIPFRLVGRDGFHQVYPDSVYICIHLLLFSEPKRGHAGCIRWRMLQFLMRSFLIDASHH